MSFITRINQSKEILTDTDIKITEYLSKNSVRAAVMSTQEIGENIGVSSSAVIRFMHRINYKNLNELRADLSRTSTSDNTACENIELFIDGDDDTAVISQKVSKLIGEVTQTTAELLNCSAMDKAAEKMCLAETIYLFGIGASGLVAEDLYQKLIRLRKNIVWISDSHIQMINALHTTSNDVAVFFSYSGLNHEIQHSIQRASQNGCYCIAVTKAGGSPIESCADCVCHIPNTENDYRLGALSSRYSELFISDILFLHFTGHILSEVPEKVVESRDFIKELQK